MDTLHPKTPYTAQKLDPDTVYHLDGRAEIHTNSTGAVSKVIAQPGHKGAWNAELSHPLPDVHYEIHNPGGSTLTVDTDHLARPTHVEVHRMQHTGADPTRRHGYSQRLTGALGHRLDPEHRRYDGGHWLANMLGGPGERINLFPQLRKTNREDFRHLEDLWRKVLADDPTARLDVDIDVQYGPGPTPSSYEVSTYRDGSLTSQQEFAN